MESRLLPVADLEPTDRLIAVHCGCHLSPHFSIQLHSSALVSFVPSRCDGSSGAGLAAAVRRPSVPLALWDCQARWLSGSTPASLPTWTQRSERSKWTRIPARSHWSGQWSWLDWGHGGLGWRMQCMPSRIGAA